MASPTATELDELFELLQNRRRRYALYYLRQERRPVGIEALAAALAEWEADDGPVSGETVRSIGTALAHAHLPSLAESGIVSYDREHGTVTLADAERVDPYLTETVRVDRPASVVADDDDD